MMNDVTKKDKDEFRREFKSWLSAECVRDPGFILPETFMEVGSDQQFEFLREWQYKLWSAGYLGMGWPKEYGGGGVSTAYQKIVDEELAAFRAPIAINAVGLNWTGPLIKDFGTEEQKLRYLKGILSAEDIWCQGFSEPDNGSDLGNVQCRAVRDGDEYVVNGSKIWTTLGNYAKYMILLARTDPDASRKYDGLSFFLAPMTVEGIDPRPIQKLTGEYGFCETFFTDARIPQDCLMGEEGAGWRVAMQTLQYERGAEAGAAGGQIATVVGVDRVIDSLRSVQRDGQPILDDPVVRDQLVSFFIRWRVCNLLDIRSAIPALTSDYPSSLLLSRKLIGTEFIRALRKFTIQCHGANGGLYVGDEGAIEGGFWQRGYLNSFSATIGGGTSQIQANIVAERVLGLPKS